MIVEDKDPAFWDRVAHHPDVWPHVALGHDFDFQAALQSPLTRAFRAEHGGWLFVRLDSLARVYDIHAMFTPEGWGREVALALRACLTRLFSEGAQVFTWSEMAGRKLSGPASYGFKAAGPFAISGGFNFRTWILTRAAWETSPVHRRMEQSSCRS